MVTPAAPVGERQAPSKHRLPVGRATAEPSTSVDRSRRELVQLKWLSTLVPGAAVLLYETVRYETLEHLLPGIPPIVGNVVVALGLLCLTYAFASFVFRVVERVQADAVRRGAGSRRPECGHRRAGPAQSRAARRAGPARGLPAGAAGHRGRAGPGGPSLGGGGRARAVAARGGRPVPGRTGRDRRLHSRVAEGGLVAALRDYLDEFEERHGIPVVLEAPETAVCVPDLVGMHVFRIVQETLANTRKHADARSAWVTLRISRQSMAVEIGDDGVGFDPTRTPGSGPRSFGLTSMRERAEALGGWLHLESTPGASTRVLVSVPLDPDHAHGEEDRRSDVAPAAG